MSKNDENKVAVIVRFSEAEWDDISRLFCYEPDLEAVMRKYILKIITGGKSSRCPEVPESELGRKNLKVFCENNRVRVAMDYTEGKGCMLKGEAEAKDITEAQALMEVVEGVFYDDDIGAICAVEDDKARAERCLSLRKWRFRALQAEAELAELRAKLAELAGVSED